MSCHSSLTRSLLKIGPSAKPSAGRAKAADARPPAAKAPPVIRPRRVTVSPSKAPGMFRSAVYGDFLFLGAGAIWSGLGLYRDALAQRPAASSGRPSA